jgi:hypothetical protein
MISTATRLIGVAFGPFLLMHLLLGFGVVINTGVPGNDEPQVKIGQEFLVKVGQQLTIADNLRVKFVSVPEDSRCPSDVNCVWAGNAVVTVEFAEGECTTTLRLNTHHNPQSPENAKAGPYRVKLVKLDPYPRSTQKISAGDYTATLVVTKD